MRPEIDEVLIQRGGVATRAQLLQSVTRHQLDHEVRTGHLIAPFSGAFCRPWHADELRELAAVVSVGKPVVLSHLSALHRWGLSDGPAPEPVHVSVPATRCPRPQAGLAIHRLSSPARNVGMDGVRVTNPAETIVATWPMLADRDRRAPAITAVRERLTTPMELEQRLAGHRRLPRRAELARLIQLLAAGCESELEIWGVLNVFDVPGLRHGRRQLWLSTPAGAYRIDLGYERERVAVELDGHRYHSSREQRERDMRRDAALASIGWLTLRFSGQRLDDDVPGCRRDTLAALATRRH